MTGVLSMSKKREADSNCKGTLCTPEGKAAADSGKTLATASTIGFGVGIAGLAAATVIWFASPARTTAGNGAGLRLLVASPSLNDWVVGASGQW